MMKPASPRTGGMIWPEVDATASIAPAMFGRNPRCFIIGMVRRPVSTTFATACPMTEATMPLPMMAGKAAPPRTWLPATFPISMTSFNMPTPSRIAA